MSATFKTDAVQASFRMDGRPITNVELNPAHNVYVVIKIDRLTLAVGDLDTMVSLSALWNSVSEVAGALPMLKTDLLNFGGSMGISQLAVRADLHGKHDGTAFCVLATEETVAHVRIQFGGLTWLVEDFLAYTTVAQALERAVTILAEGLADRQE